MFSLEGRMLRCKLLEKMHQNPKTAERLGLIDRSRIETGHLLRKNIVSVSDIENHE